MENKVLGFCPIAAVLGIIAAATGFAAEITNVKASDVHIVDGTCIYPSSPALTLGIVSVVFTIITRIYLSVSFGGACYCQNDTKSNSKILFVLSWVASVIAAVLLLAAVTINHRQGGEVDSYGYITCYVVKPGIFAAGATLALFSAVFGIAAYTKLTPPPQTNTNPTVANVDPERNPVSFHA